MVGPHLNGLKIPLIIDTAMLIGGIVTVTLMWANIHQLQAEQAQSVSAERIARLEEQEKQLAAEEQQLREEMQRIWQERHK